MISGARAIAPAPVPRRGAIRGAPAPDPALPPGLSARRRRAVLVLWIEQVWPAFAPVLGVVAVFFLAALLGVQAALGPLGRLLVLVLAAASAGALALRGLRALRPIDRAAADRRLERASGLAHRPLAVLTDRPAGGASEALWRAHRERAARAVRALRVGWPHPGLAARDRLGLRGGLAVALVAALAIAGPRAPERLAAAFAPGLGLPAAPAPQVAAWITPPAYTGLAPIALGGAGGALTVPEGARLRVGISGGSGRIRLRFAGRALAATPLGQDGKQARMVLHRSGLLAIGRGGASLGAWRITVLPARPPVVAWAGAPGPLRADPRAIGLPWRTRDAYGVVGLQAELRLYEHPGAAPRLLPIALPPRAAPPGTGRSKTDVPGNGVVQSGLAIRDLTADPWAGLRVTARLVARNGAGLSGVSPPIRLRLPERIFRNPLARAIIRIRRGLSLRPEDRVAAAKGLAALRAPGTRFGTAFGAWLELGLDIRRLGAPPSADQVPAVQRSLWRVAVSLEDRARDPTVRALARARRAVRAALERALRDPSAANRAALAARIAALEQRIAARLARLGAELRQQGLTPPQAEATRQAIDQALQRMAEHARQDAAQGSLAAAQARLGALNRMLDQLDGAAGAIAHQRQAMAALQAAEKRLAALNALLRREATLLDHAHLRLGQMGALAQGQEARAAAQAIARGADAVEQRAVRGALTAMAGQPGGKAPGMRMALRAMRGAEAALDDARDRLAAGAEQAAIAALSQAGKAMGQALAQQAGALGSGAGMLPGMGTAGLPEWLPGLGGDPLGREGNRGRLDPAARVWLPAEQRLRRTRRIENELRRREGEPSRPPEELRYIDRLLRQF